MKMQSQRCQFTEWGRRIQTFATKGPLYHYNYSLWRLRRSLNRQPIGLVVLDEPSSFAQFDLTQPSLAMTQKAVAEGNYKVAKEIC